MPPHEPSPIPAASAAASVVDRVQLAQRSGDSPELMRELIELFLSVQPPDMSALRTAVDMRDLARARRLAHKVAGSFASLAMDRLAQQALALEQLAIAGRHVSCAEGFARLESDWKRARAELDALLRELSAA